MTSRIKLSRSSFQHLVYFQFNLINRLMLHSVSSCSYFQYMFKQVHLNSFSFVLLKKLPRYQDILETVSSFSESEDIFGDNVCGCCTGGAPSILKRKPRFQFCVKKWAQKEKDIHRMIIVRHRPRKHFNSIKRNFRSFISNCEIYKRRLLTHDFSSSFGLT